VSLLRTLYHLSPPWTKEVAKHRILAGRLGCFPPVTPCLSFLSVPWDSPKGVIRRLLASTVGRVHFNDSAALSFLFGTPILPEQAEKPFDALRSEYFTGFLLSGFGEIGHSPQCGERELESTYGSGRLGFREKITYPFSTSEPGWQPFECSPDLRIPSQGYVRFPLPFPGDGERPHGHGQCPVFTFYSCVFPVLYSFFVCR